MWPSSGLKLKKLIQQPVNFFEQWKPIKRFLKTYKGGFEKQEVELGAKAGVCVCVCRGGKYQKGRGPWQYWMIFLSLPLSPTVFLLPLGLHCLKRRWLISALWMKWAIKSEFRPAIQPATGLLWCFCLHFTQHLQEELQLFIKNLWILFVRVHLE